MLVAPYPNAASNGVYRTLNAVMQGYTHQQSSNADKVDGGSQSLLEWNRFGTTPAVNIIWGRTIPPIENSKLLSSEDAFGGAREKASKKMNTLGRKMNTNVLNLFLRIFLSHNDSVVIIIRLDHWYTFALAEE